MRIVVHIFTFSDVFPGKLVEQPTVDTAEHQLVPLSSLSQPRDIVQHPEQPHGHHLVVQSEDGGRFVPGGVL